MLAAGKRFSTPYFAVRFLWRADLLPARAAFVVSKRIGGAVTRNRTKRRLREALRKAKPLPEGLDLLLVAHTESSSARFQELEEAIDKSMVKIGTNPQG